MKIKLKKCLFILSFITPLILAVPAIAETGFLGLEIQGFDKRGSKLLGQINQSGVLVKNVAIGEAGAKAGFRRGDLIIRFDGSKITDFDSLV